VDWLAAHGLITYETNSRGFQVKVIFGSRFTWVPSYGDDRLLRASPRACKALLAICRAVRNATRSIRMRAQTLAERLGRSIRTAHLALKELRERQMIDSLRTGRSSWFTVIFEDPQQKLVFGDTVVAHRQRLLLRILRSISQTDIAGVLTHLARRAKEVADGVRSALFNPTSRQRRYASKRLERFGLDSLTIGVLVDSFTPDEINDVLSACTDRTSPETIEHRLRRGLF
jgi:hypothetical protein